MDESSGGVCCIRYDYGRYLYRIAEIREAWAWLLIAWYGSGYQYLGGYNGQWDGKDGIGWLLFILAFLCTWEWVGHPEAKVDWKKTGSKKKRAQLARKPRRDLLIRMYREESGMNGTKKFAMLDLLFAKPDWKWIWRSLILESWSFVWSLLFQQIARCVNNNVRITQFLSNWYGHLLQYQLP